MTLLTVWRDTSAEDLIAQTTDHDEIARLLGDVGVDFQHDAQWMPLPAKTSPEEILKSHQSLIERLVQEQGYTLVDVAQLHPEESAEWQQLALAARSKFLNEHTHDEDEVRYFVEGSGVFYLHLDERVYAVLCQGGDLLSVPALTTHWFDMGIRPDFTAIRFFQSDDGWVGNFTGSDISQRFPDFHELTSALLARA